LRRSSVSRYSTKRKQRDAVYPQRRREVYERADGLCEVGAVFDCTRRCEQVHHVAGRGGDDPHRLSNLLGACAPCHRFIHANPEVSRERGWMRSRVEPGL